MGMVLLEYDPVKVCWEYTDNPEDVEWMRRELFDSKEWSAFRRGNADGCTGSWSGCRNACQMTSALAGEMESLEHLA